MSNEQTDAHEREKAEVLAAYREEMDRLDAESDQLCEQAIKKQKRFIIAFLILGALPIVGTALLYFNDFEIPWVSLVFLGITLLAALYGVCISLKMINLYQMMNALKLPRFDQ